MTVQSLFAHTKRVENVSEAEAILSVWTTLII